MDTNIVRIMIVDDHDVVRLGLRKLLASHPGWKIVADVATAAEAIQLADKYEPDVILMDIRLKDGNGIDACREIITVQPGIKIIILTSYAEDELLLDALAAGAVGYVLKQVSNDDLIEAIEIVSQGESLLDSETVDGMLAEIHETILPEAFADLTEQELQVLALIAKGQTNREIAANLHLGEGTARNYVSSIFTKLNLTNRAEATAYAVRHHLDRYIDALD